MLRTLFIFCMVLFSLAFAQDDGLQPEPDGQTLEGVIISTQPLTARVQGEEVPITNDSDAKLSVGTRIQVYKTPDPKGGTLYYFADYLRYPTLIWLTVLFMVIAAAVGRGKGIRAVLGMFLSLGVILAVVVPLILAGWNPIGVALLGSFGILLFSVYFVHGLNWTTTAALVATLATAALAVGLAWAVMDLAHLSGLMNDESMYLQQMMQGVDLRGLLLGSMIIGALGALVDSTIPQAAVVRELAHLKPEMSWQELYRSSMRVGLDHIGSLINTLVLAYAGSSLSLFVVFQAGSLPFSQAVNMELVASAIVQSLVGSIGLILAVPLTTFMAAWVFQKGRLPAPKHEELHHHHHHH